MTAPETASVLPGTWERNDDGRLRRIHVPTPQLEATVHSLVTADHGRLADLFADTDSYGNTVLYLVWALDRDGYYLLLDSPVSGGEYPPLSDIAPAAFVEECEIYEQFGLRPAGGKPLNRLAVPPQADSTVPRLGHAPPMPPADVHAPHTVGGQAFEFPVGPVRGAGAESLYFGLVTSGEEIVDLYLMTWHKHRGIEWRLRGRTPGQAMFVVERAEGLSAVAHGWAFAAAVEDAWGIIVPAAVTRVRAVALELERLYNHAAAIAALCQSTGLQVGQARAEIALEALLRCNLAVFGHRYLFGVLDIGGVARTPDLTALHELLPAAHDELRRVADALSVTNSFLDRLEATGVVAAEQVRRLGLVGPIARAAGVPIDTRRDHPQPGLRLPPAAPQRSTGDVLSRYLTFLAELDSSTDLLLTLVDDVDTGTHTDSEAGGGCGQGLGWAESARGEALAFVRLDDAGRIERARLRPAAVRNWRGFDDAARSQNVFTDIPIIEASFWLTVAGVAR
jgi:Ni,Fe-hydrogenase III large subunit/Ni,Fe-hydrogenase III component G